MNKTQRFVWQSQIIDHLENVLETYTGEYAYVSNMAYYYKIKKPSASYIRIDFVLDIKP